MKSPDTELSKEDKNKLKNLWEKYLKNLKGAFERQRDTYNKEKTASIEKAQNFKRSWFNWWRKGRS